MLPLKFTRLSILPERERKQSNSTILENLHRSRHNQMLAQQRKPGNDWAEPN
jgi:hypothetical protein